MSGTKFITRHIHNTSYESRVLPIFSSVEMYVINFYYVFIESSNKGKLKHDFYE